MPAYVVEFETEEGPRRGQFVIDPERALGAQVRQVLEELRHHGTVIAGGPGDELGVWWNGRELDLSSTPASLTIAPSRPLQVRMRPAAAPIPEPPLTSAPRRRPRRLTRGALAGPLTGAAGALLAWCAASGVRDLRGAINGYERLDLLVALLVGALAAAGVAGGAALRTQGRVAYAAMLGTIAGALGGGMGGAAGLVLAGLLPDDAPFALRRTLAWLVLGAAAGGAAALPWARRDPGRLAEGAACGALGGAAAGGVFSLAGPGDVWQALAFMLLGAGIGAGVCSLALRRAAGVLELEAVEGRGVGLLRHREWDLREGALVYLRTGPGRRPAARVAIEAGRAWAAPGAESATVTVSGHTVDRPTELADGDRLEVGTERYRYRRLAPLAAAILLALAARPADAQEGSLRLVRCGHEGRAACLSTQATLLPEEARGVTRAGEPGGIWRVEAGPASTPGVRGVVVKESRPPLRMLVLVDVSGSMKGPGMQTARSALRAFLDSLPAGSVRAAVAPFASARVEERIRAARFVDARAAVAQVDALPGPAGNTGLYSAVRAGLDRLAAEREAAGGAGWDALLVITDGKNDVGDRGDDPGLLAEAAGQRVAVGAIRRSATHVFAVGFGTGVDGRELSALGGVRGESFTVAEDPLALRRALAIVSQWVVTARALLVPVGGAGEARLTAGPVRLRAARMGAERKVVHAGPWTPPLYALPAFQGSPPEGTRVVATTNAWLPRRLGVLALFTGVLVILWTAVPPLLSVPPAPPVRVRAAGHPRPERPAVRVPVAAGVGAAPRIRLRGPAGAARATAAVTDADGLRRDLREAPARRPTDVTAEVRRRAGRRG